MTDLLEEIADGVAVLTMNRPDRLNAFSWPMLDAWHHSRTGETEDHREAARAFVDKREPVFKGR